MSTKIQVLTAEERSSAGKGSSRALRREGKVPAIIYGGKKDNVMVSLNSKELYKEYAKGGLMSRVIDLKIGNESNLVLPKNIQLHPVNDTLEHADFIRVNKGEKVNVLVKINFQNVEKSAGVKRGGIFNIVRRELELVCDFDKIPDEVAIDVTNLGIGDNIHIKDINLPEGSEPSIQRNFTIATVVGRLSEEEELRRTEAATSAAEAAQAALKAADEAARTAPAADKAKEGGATAAAAPAKDAAKK